MDGILPIDNAIKREKTSAVNTKEKIEEFIKHNKQYVDT
jgi:hypothetical protein